MCYTTFISALEASSHLKNDNFLFVDCSYSLSDEHWGLRQYEESHIPGALYLDLHKDLSGKIIPKITGRHPLPEKKELIEVFSRAGIQSNTQVIAYDATFGAMAASRLWWLLKWGGHECVAVLNGGKAYWERNNLPLNQDIFSADRSSFNANFKDNLLVSTENLFNDINEERICLIDSRTADRYEGRNETIDSKAGHIPNAISRPFNQLIDDEGLVMNKRAIRKYFDGLEHNNITFYCGSGVTATFNILLFVHAGGNFPKLYAGSWSEWITDESRPIIL